MTGDPAVRFDHVSKRFGANDVLADVSFEVATGEAFCILGRSGTGKSVTLKHIIGLLTPDAGRIVVHGQDITRLGRAALTAVRRRMGFLFQNAALFDSISVGENVAFPLRRHTDLSSALIAERTHLALESVGMGAHSSAMPGDLSGGMRKRVGLARAMALDPAILLVDEPSAGLDPITSAEIDDLLLARKRAGTTLIIVTHNIPSARALGDTLVMLDRGRIVAQGTATELEGSTDPLVARFLRAAGSGG
jgi:phospholipid/cholesterol/gamma-HCH transport system ATP-binding protein